MVKTTVYLEEETAARLKLRAAATGRSQAEIIREAVDNATRPRVSPHWGKFTSKEPNVGMRVKEILREAVSKGEWP
ncbi:MAG: ribbon-helix-helix protein, CopG family [Bryobacteraceae bacterium]|nr:ribbon-helix-helix protein, CopG family [Bryobacteraceae bacterium]